MACMIDPPALPSYLPHPPPSSPTTYLQDVTLSWGQKKGYIVPQARIVVSKLFSPFLAQYLCTNVSF